MKLEPSASLDQLARRVIGAAIEVHRHLGPGFLESIYETALLHELEANGIHAQTQLAIKVPYKSIVAGESRVDLLVEEQLVVELKAVEALTTAHSAQVLSYLRATGCHLGLLINFNTPLLRDGVRRIILDTDRVLARIRFPETP